ncbi:VTT domain-containing protein [Alkaliphilus sp. MSJ-5]|uniref:TVP38/TMEM64 family membrane protein n=1 Tax=Alkaliphilus flagellatus TaxID=2841507 RepID=A0ABS6FYK1_9FIRM|nr:VTT domain-containing protein [Alkaliphilus flagellatus]
MNNTKDKIMLVCCLLIIIGALTGIIIYATSSGIMDIMTSIESFKTYIDGFGNKAIIIFFIIQFMSVVIAPIPSNISTAAGGIVFGIWKTFITSTLAVILGSMLVFILSRKFGKPLTDKFVSQKIAGKYGQLVESKSEMLLIAMFLLPFFPDDSICFLAGLSKIKCNRFFAIMLLTRPWGLLVSSVVGATNITIPWWGWISIVLLVVVLFILIQKYGDKIEDKLMDIIHMKLGRNKEN